MTGVLAAFYRGEHAADLRLDGRGRVWATYTNAYLDRGMPVPMSVSAPLVSNPVEVTAWIDGLLPDHQEVRRRWAAGCEAASIAPFDLLAAEPVGWDCAGAFQFASIDRVDAYLDRPSGLEPLDDYGVAARIRRLRADRSDWMMLPQDGPARRRGFSLAGAQPKTALRRDGNGWAVPFGDEPTTHILKPPLHPDYPDMDIVEHLTMATAANLGLETAKTECREYDWERTLVVERSDRAEGAQGKVLRVHQEDLCQAMRLPSMAKYQDAGGPSPGDVGRLLRQVCPVPLAEVERFRDAFIYNWLVAGIDAHAKNYGLLFSSGEMPSMAPLYDLISYIPYADDAHLGDAAMSMDAGAGYGLRPGDGRGTWAALAASLHLPAAETAERARHLAEELPSAAAAAIDSLPSHQRSSRQVKLMSDRLPARAAACLRSMSARPGCALQGAGAPAPDPGRQNRGRRAGDGPAGRLPAQRCGHRGARTDKPCVLRLGHNGPHRYTR